MYKKEFLELLTNTLEIETQTITESTRFQDLEEYDSLSIISIVAMADEYFGKPIKQKDFQGIITVQDLVNFIGVDNIQ